MSIAESACERMRSYLHSYIDNQLSVESNHEVLSHLESCPDCRDELRQLTRLQGAVRVAVKNSVVPNSLRGDVLSRFEGRPLARTWMLIAASLVLIAIAGVSVYRNTRSLDAVMRIGLRDHVVCAVPRKYPQSPPSSQEFDAAMGPYSALTAVVRAEVPARYRLEEAHRCEVGGRQFVHLIFKDSTRLISVVLTKKKENETLPVAPAQASLQSFQIAGFDSGSYLAWVISDLSASENRQIATNVAPAIKGYLQKLATAAGGQGGGRRRLYWL